MTLIGWLTHAFGFLLVPIAGIRRFGTHIMVVRHNLQTFKSLRNRNFRWFWFNGATQSMGQGMQFLTIGWLVLELTGSASQLGLVVFLFGVPNLIFAMFGGIIADRTNRLRLLIVTRIVVALLILTLAILAIAGLAKIWHIYSVVVILGTVQALSMPARLAFVADLVESDDMMNAVTVHGMVNQTGQIMGPALAGWIIELADVGTALVLNSGLYAAGIVFLLLIRGLPKPKKTVNTTILGDLVAGLRCVRSTPVLFTILGMAIAFGFFGMSHRQVLPASAKEVLEVGAAGTGSLFLVAGLGSLLGSLVLASVGDIRRKNWLLLATILIFCVLLFLFALSPWYWVSLIIFFLVGIVSFGLFWPLATTLVQLNAPPELRGRVMSVMQLAPALHYIGGLPVVLVADLINWPTGIAGGAVLCLACALWLGVWRPILRRMEV